jgi:enamine deaminase RidA (YjgF/YER057c/UK114 family)
MRAGYLALSGLLALVGSAAIAAEPVRIVPARSGIATSVSVPAGLTTVYVSGLVPPALPTPDAAGKPSYGDTKTQTLGVLNRLADALKAHNMTLADIVMMRVYLVADPATGEMDFAGMNAAYGQFFGTAAQPNKPARMTAQVAKLAGPFLVEIEAQAAKAP